MGIIDASLGRHLASHPELRQAALAELAIRIQSLDDEIRTTPADAMHSGATVNRLYRIARLSAARRAILAN